MVDEPEMELDAEGAPPPQDEGDDVETRARKLGWIPESEWDAERAEREGRRKPVFVSAEQFIERIESDMPVLRERLKHTTEVISSLERKLTDRDKKIDEMHSIFKSQQQMTSEAVKRAREQGRKDAEAQMRAAVEENDTYKYDQAKAKLDGIIAEEHAAPPADDTDAEGEDDAPPPAKRHVDPVVDDWKARNPWFTNDLTLNNYMVECEGKIAIDSPGMTQAERLERAARQVKAKFPEKFGINPRRNGAAAVGTSRGEAGSGGGGADDAFRRIPAADQASYERHRKMIEQRSGGKEKYTKAQFMDDYGWTTGADR